LHLKTQVMCQLAVNAEDKKGLTVPMMMRKLTIAAVLAFTAALATIHGASTFNTAAGATPDISACITCVGR
jgi:hypothetical protein